MWEFLAKLIAGDSMTIFLTTHYMEEAEALCTRVAIIDSGHIIAMGSPEELKATIPGNDIVALTLEALTEALTEAVTALPFVHSVKADDNSLRVYVDSGAKNLMALIDEARRLGGVVLSATLHEQSLEDVFIHYTGKSIREEEARKVSFLNAGLPRFNR